MLFLYEDNQRFVLCRPAVDNQRFAVRACALVAGEVNQSLSSARLHIDPTAPHDWDQYFQFGPPGFDQRERSSYTNCHFYRDTHPRRDEWKKRVLLSPEHWHS